MARDQNNGRPRQQRRGIRGQPATVRRTVHLPGRGTGRCPGPRCAGGGVGRAGPGTAAPAVSRPPGPARPTGAPIDGGGRRGRAAPHQRRTRSSPRPGDRVRHRGRAAHGVSPPWATEPASGRRDAEPTGRTSLARAASAGRRGRRARLVRPRHRDDPSTNRHPNGQTPGGGPATRAAADVDDFYATRPQQPTDPGDALVLTFDGKGIVMRPDALRPATKAAARTSSSKLATRLSQGEKRNRKRMATVGAVYDLTPVPRTAADVLANSDTPTPAPKATNKWLTASVVQDTTAVLSTVFDQAQRRDPTNSRTWVALVDGNNHQIDRSHAEAKQRGVTVPVLIDFIHVLEYVWRAAWSFYREGDPDAETWVHDKALAILNGKASTVAAAIRRKATRRNLPTDRRAGADRCADYLLNKRGYLDYPTALNNGWPIATGIIEGACRHIVKDRMDITGARWGLDGAEAILKLRAVHANGDFDDYWAHHTAQEQRRIHQTRYANAVIPRAA